ncbi:MAG: alpha/beta fold hydrolase [Candidatus Abyssobacteria bacterium SURF_17]|uniref:Alpha/beta fold hydrolase n=1 Tax=Candidatus Abyssobacteria bacterium SURF_17 TaxID=2093361 RepID=A0A419F622_9BACT|nr:MAG: alpha/beta fold hydrolase [Candidatus Abyssubacteria bacterium SURF_17]
MVKEKQSPAFSFVRGDVGCLLVHGFGDTAALMEPMRVHLNTQGVITKAITLPGHGTSLKDFANISNQKLLGMVEMEYARLKENNDAAVIVGFSMGGLLALQLATMRGVDGVVTICAPAFPKGGVAGERTLKLAAKLGSVLGANIPKLGFTSLADKTLSEYLVGYKSYPSQSVLRLVEMMEATRAIFKRVTAPILIVQSRRDDVIWKDSGKHIFDSVSSTEKRLVHLENSRHKAPLDRDRHILFDEVGRFCLSCVKRPAS